MQAPKLPTHVVAGIPPSSQASTAKSSTRTSKVTPRPSMKVPPLGFTTGAAPLNKPRDQSLKSVPPQSTLKGGRQCASSPAFKQGVPSSVDRSRIATRPPSNKSAGASSSRKPSHGPYGPPNSQPQVKSKGKPTVPAAGNPSSPSSRLRSVPPRLSQHTPKPPVQSPLPSPQSLAPPNKKTANKKTASQPTVPSTRSPQPHLSNVQKVVQLGFRTSRPGLQFFSYTGWEWEEVKGEGHTTFTAAYWLWKSSVRRHPQLLVECTIGGAAYILDWYNMVSAGAPFID